MERKKHFSRHPHFRALKGFSLIELLIAVALGSIVMAAVYAFLSQQARVYSAQDEMAEMEQNLRTAMEKITRDVSMAGFGKPWWGDINGETNITYKVQQTGGNTLDIVGCLDPPAGHLASAANGATAIVTSLALNTGEGNNFNTSTKKDINVEGRECLRITGTSSNTLTIDRNPGGSGNQGLQYSYPVNSKVYLVKHVTYSVDTSVDPPILRIDEHQGAGSQPVAENVSAMAVSISGSLVTITLTGRTRHPDRTSGAYITAQMTSGVKVRN